MIISSCGKDKSDNYTKVTPLANKYLSGKVIPDDQFLGDQKCKECHPNQFEKWEGSHHDKAMQIADSITILGDFNNATFTSQEITSRFFKKGRDFYVNTEGKDGKYHDYKIEYTFGITPLQQYIVKFPDGHYQCLRTAWDTEKNKWFDLYPDFKVVHSEWLHWSRGGLNWNNMCADCHSTNVRKNYDDETKSYNTRYAILNVSCEACHGSGKQHVSDVTKIGEGYTNTNTFQMTLNTKPKELVDQCARCHMRREMYSEHFNFEGTLLDHYYPQLIEKNLYHADGQILDEVYVYGSFLQSKMYQNDVTCTNCHDAHSLQLKFTGNALCTQCHETTTYDSPKHHFHPQNTESSKCINCHMTGKVYMGNDYRRDHSFRIPRPDLSLKYGSPNACTKCHTDKDDTWAWNNFQKLFGQVDSVHFSDKLAPAIANLPNADKGLISLINSKKTPEIIRASATKVLSNYNLEEHINIYISLLDDDSPLVRAASIDVLGTINSRDYVSYFLPLLQDDKRTVRVKAFFALAFMDEFEVPEMYLQDYKRVKDEFWKQMKSNADFSGIKVREGDFFLKKGNLQKAIDCYEQGLTIDNVNNQIRTNLAMLYYNNQQYDKAEEAYLKVIKQEPGFGPVYYSLALLYGELNRVDDAIYQLERAKEIMPENIRVYYNLGLLNTKKGDFKKAERNLGDGLKIDTNNESLLYALAYTYSQSNQKVKAKNILQRLVSLYPNNQQYQAFLNQLQ